MKQTVPVVVNKKMLIPISKVAKLFSRFNGKKLGCLTEGILARHVAETGRTSRIIGLTDLEGIKRINENFVFVSINDPMTFAELYKRREEFKGKILIIGGQLPSSMPDLFRHYFPEANIFIGECEGKEQRIKRILEDAESGKQGLTYSYETPNLEQYYLQPLRPGKNDAFEPMEIGRGCIYGCSFCGLPKVSAKTRTRRADDILDELSRMGKGVLFLDSNLSIYDRKLLFEIFEYMERTKRMWVGEGTAKELVEDPELWDLMSRTCLSFLTGLEDKETPELSGAKNNSGLLLPKNGTIIMHSMIIGHPNQGEMQFESMKRLIRRYNLSHSAHIYTPYPGCRDFGKLLAQGLITQPDFSRYNRKEPVVEHPLGARRIMQIFKENHGLNGFFKTLQELKRIIKDSKPVLLTVLRVLTLIGLRLRSYFGSKFINCERPFEDKPVVLLIPEVQELKKEN